MVLLSYFEPGSVLFSAGVLHIGLLASSTFSHLSLPAHCAEITDAHHSACLVFLLPEFRGLNSGSWACVANFSSLEPSTQLLSHPFELLSLTFDVCVLDYHLLPLIRVATLASPTLGGVYEIEERRHGQLSLTGRNGY